MPNSLPVSTTNPNHLGTSHSGWGRCVLLALLGLGLDGRRIFVECGLDPDVQGQSLVRNPVSRMQYVWQRAETSVEDKNLLATSIVRYMNASSFHALGFGLYASSSIAGLFQRMCRYCEVISSSVKMECGFEGRNFRYRIVDLRPVKSHLTSVVALLYLIRICHELSGPEVSPIRIDVPWEDGQYNEAIQREMDSPIYFRQPHHGLTFDAKVARRPLPSGQSQLASLQDRLCREYLHSLEEHRHFPSRVRLKILQSLSSNMIAVGAIADSLHMSPRTLQRRLLAEGTSFRAILRDVRIELVQEYASNPDVPATQIAYMLGFGGVSQFSTQFKSWFGQTLTDYRAELGMGNA